MIISQPSIGKLVDNFKTAKNANPKINVAELQKVCRLDIDKFSQYGKRYDPPGGKPYFFKDNGSDILAVFHADISSLVKATHFTPAKMAHDTWYFCPTMDDRAGGYAILYHLPRLGLTYDILITTGEEQGDSSAKWFVPPRRYNWAFSCDRRGTDVVMYQYHNYDSELRLKREGWTVGTGSYSDIRELESLRCKAFNFGVGYHDEHTLNCYLSEKEFLTNMLKLKNFYIANCDQRLVHLPRYNIYLKDEGFGYFRPGGSHLYQDTFTENEIELLEELERNDFPFPPSLSKNTLVEVLKGIEVGELKNKEGQLELKFDEVVETVVATDMPGFETCKACSGSGTRSNGTECWPCAGTGIHLYRRNLIGNSIDEDAPLVIIPSGNISEESNPQAWQELSDHASEFNPIVTGAEGLVSTRDETKSAIIAHSVITPLNAPKTFGEQKSDVEGVSQTVEDPVIECIARVVPQGIMEKHGNKKTTKPTYQKVGPGGSWAWYIKSKDGKHIRIDSIVQVDS